MTQLEVQDISPTLSMHEETMVIDIVFESSIPNEVLTQPSIINCCESYDHSCNCCKEYVDSRICDVEDKYKRLLKSVDDDWKTRFEIYDAKIAKLTIELAETSKQLQTQHRAHSLSSSSMTSSSADDVPFPHSLALDTNLLRQQCEESNDKDSQNICISNDDTATTDLSITIEQIIQSKVKYYMEKAVEQQIIENNSVRQEIETQIQQLISLQKEVIDGIELHHCEYLFQNSFHGKVKRMEKEMKVMWKMLNKYYDDQNSSISNGLVAQGKEDRPIPANEGCTVSDSMVSILEQKCVEIIQKESERLMQTWGTQFDDLVVYMQSNLDSQTTCIADARTSTFDHVDAEAQTRAAVWNTKLKQIVGQNHQHEIMIQEIRDGQEKSFTIIVETLVNLKTKIQSMAEQIYELDTKLSSSEEELHNVRNGVKQSAAFLCSKVNHFEGKMQMLQDTITHISKEIDDVMEDRESVHTTLAASIEIFNAKTDTCVDLCNAQLQHLDKRSRENNEAGQLQLQNLHKHVNDIEIVVTAICKKLLEPIPGKASVLGCKKPTFNKIKGFTEVTRDDAIDINKIKNRGNLFEEKVEDEIEFIDLS